MNLMSKLLKPVMGAIAIGASAVAIAQPADAFTVNFGGTLAADGSGFTTAVEGASVVNFNGIAAGTRVGAAVPVTNPNPLVFSLSNGTATYSGASDNLVGEVVRGTVRGQYRAPGTFVENPTRDPAPDDNTNYLAVGGVERPGPVTISFASGAPLNYFGAYIGSLDSFNRIQFFRPGAATHFVSFTGQQLLDRLRMATGNMTLPASATSTYANFLAGNPNEYFDRIVLSSTSAALESDNHAFRVVPTPALVPAALGFAAAMLKKRKGESEVEAEQKAEA